jgi:hypothetical protein
LIIDMTVVSYWNSLSISSSAPERKFGWSTPLDALAAREDLFEQLREVIDGHLHLEPHETQGGSVVEQHDQDHAPGHIGEIHRLFLALMEQRIEVGLADQPGKLIVGAEISGRQRGERGRIEGRLLADGRHQLSRPIDQQSAPRVALVEEAMQGLSDRPIIVFRERPAR